MENNKGCSDYSGGLYRNCIKRPLDVLVASMALFVLSPIILITAVLVKIKLGSPVLFRQDRPGLYGKIFRMYKFRTMSDARDESGELLSDDKRLTSFGKALRATSLDELPELLNIIKGDMAIVGPRPLAAIYLPFYTKEERHRHDVRPGLTGLAQVNGRNNLGWDEKLKYDIEYVDSISFLGDLRIFFKTIMKVFVHEGIGQGEERPVSLHEEREHWIIDDDGAIRPQA